MRDTGAQQPQAYQTILGFQLFVMVNATVIFGPPERRWGYAAILVILATVWLWRTRSAAKNVVSDE